MKKLLLALTTAFLCQGDLAAKELIFTAIGDQPYISEDSFKELINRINNDSQSEFTIHVGDIKNGATTCSDERFLRIRDLFNHFNKPLIYTPGDNEWTDCHRTSNGSYQQLERLGKIREIFFKESSSLGSQRIKIERQGDLDKRYSSYIENSRWTNKKILFVTIHQVGSNNNLDHNIPGAISEFQERNMANMAWLNQSFNLAKKENISAIVVAMQSDIFDPRIPKESGFTDFIKNITRLGQEFKKPILLIQGDSHQYKVDQPFFDDTGKKMPQIFRVIVPGASSIEAVQITINTDKLDANTAFNFYKY